jgi:glycosyltransferase involved in cell wall biosynthesis
MLSVLMATYNGSQTLRVVLGAYRMLQPPRGGWKLVIVDNASTDDTKDVIGACAEQLPLTYVFEPKRGKNMALNTGLTHIQGDLVVFTDDDAVPRPDWLAQLRAAADSQPSFSIFGGAVLPKWESDPEAWITNWVPLSVTYALTDPDWPEGPITPRRVFEPNSAYRAHIFEAGYRFDPAIGPAGSNYAMGSGSEFHVRLMKAGYTAWHCKRAVVEHIIRKWQMEKDWILSRAFRYGRGQYRQEMKDALRDVKHVFGVPRFFFREILTQGLRVARTRLGNDEHKLFLDRWELNFLIGKAYEARAIHQYAKKSQSARALK